MTDATDPVSFYLYSTILVYQCIAHLPRIAGLRQSAIDCQPGVDAEACLYGPKWMYGVLVPLTVAFLARTWALPVLSEIARELPLAGRIAARL